MNQEFLPYNEALSLKELGFNEKCAAHYLDEDDLELKWEIYRNLSIDTYNCLQAPTYRQAFKFFRDKYGFTYSIGKTNICVYHIGNSTQMIQDCKTYEEAELKCIQSFINQAKTN